MAITPPRVTGVDGGAGGLIAQPLGNAPVGSVNLSRLWSGAADTTAMLVASKIDRLDNHESGRLISFASAADLTA
jgi:hypothetical protein